MSGTRDFDNTRWKLLEAAQEGNALAEAFLVLSFSNEDFFKIDLALPQGFHKGIIAVCNEFSNDTEYFRHTVLNSSHKEFDLAARRIPLTLSLIRKFEDSTMTADKKHWVNYFNLISIGPIPGARLSLAAYIVGTRGGSQLRNGMHETIRQAISEKSPSRAAQFDKISKDTRKQMSALAPQTYPRWKGWFSFLAKDKDAPRRISSIGSSIGETILRREFEDENATWNDEMDEHGWTPLHYALGSGHLVLAGGLVAAGAKFRNTGSGISCRKLFEMSGIRDEKTFSSLESKSLSPMNDRRKKTTTAL